jgi:cell division protein FtsI/penicillin-binding protein 2
MTEALARSLNVITAQWSLLLGADTFYKYLDRFGFGQVTEIDLAGEVYGLSQKARASTGLVACPTWAPTALARGWR